MTAILTICAGVPCEDLLEHQLALAVWLWALWHDLQKSATTHNRHSRGGGEHKLSNLGPGDSSTNDPRRNVCVEEHQDSSLIPD
jgi:hypothetical protein